MIDKFENIEFFSDLSNYFSNISTPSLTFFAQLSTEARENWSIEQLFSSLNTPLQFQKFLKFTNTRKSAKLRAAFS